MTDISKALDTAAETHWIEVATGPMDPSWSELSEHQRDICRQNARRAVLAFLRELPGKAYYYPPAKLIKMLE